jgi:ribosome biogenesis GTPase
LISIGNWGRSSPFGGAKLAKSRLVRQPNLVPQGTRLGWRTRRDFASFAPPNGLDRPPIANANQILLVFALADPPLDPYQLSKFLVKAESTDLDVCLCLNKSDLVSEEQLQQWRDRLHGWGYQPIFISVHTRMGMEELQAQLNDKITVFAGLSGVGKSSIVNYFIEDVNLRVAEVSGKLSRGRHTTRHVELFELPTGGLLADTPGFNQPDLDCLPEELVEYFPEAQKRLEVGRCQFSDCLHRDEPNCAVRGDWERYEHYLDFWKMRSLAANISTNNPIPMPL